MKIISYKFLTTSAEIVTIVVKKDKHCFQDFFFLSMNEIRAVYVVIRLLFDFLD